MKGFYGAQEIVVDEKLVKDFHVLLDWLEDSLMFW